MPTQPFEPSPTGPAVPAYARQVVATLPGMYLLLSLQLVVRQSATLIYNRPAVKPGR
jgi:hypothetical protein